jgi:hypothetical protein
VRIQILPEAREDLIAGYRFYESQARGLDLEIERCYEFRQIRYVKAAAKRRAKSEAELLDHATNNLARALKRDMLKKNGRIDYEKLRKEGYSERLLAKLEQA